MARCSLWRNRTNQDQYFSKKGQAIVQVDREHAIETVGGEVLDKRSFPWEKLLVKS